MDQEKIAKFAEMDIDELEQLVLEYSERLENVEDEDRIAFLEAELECIQAAIDLKSDSGADQPNGLLRLSDDEKRSTGLMKLNDNDDVKEAREERIKKYKDKLSHLERKYFGDGYVQPRRHYSICKKLAYMGDPESLYELGVIFETGKGVEKKDINKAVRFIKRSAELGNAMALGKLGYYYENGIAVDKDLHQAEKLYLAAIDAGNYKAALLLANLYNSKKLGSPDYRKAFDHYNLAATNGVNEALMGIAGMYEFGHGVIKNLQIAESYYREAESYFIKEKDKKRARKRIRVIKLSNNKK